MKVLTIDMTFERREVLIREEERKNGREEGADMLARLLKKLDPAGEEFQIALNASAAEREELYKKYNIS